MEPFKDGAESVKDEIVKRMRSPFLGAFVIAWCAVNYEFLIVVFSDGNYADKIAYIARRFFHDSDLLHSFGLPLGLAAGSTLALPLVNLATDLWVKFVDILGTQMRLWMETKRRLSDPELRETARSRKHLADAVRQYAKGVIGQHSQTATRMYLLGQGENQGSRRFPGLSGRPELALDGNVKRLLEEYGLPLVGYRMLQALGETSMLNESSLFREATMPGKPLTAATRDILGVLIGMHFVKLIWDEGPEPAYALALQGKLVLTAVENWYPELFSATN